MICGSAVGVKGEHSFCVSVEEGGEGVVVEAELFESLQAFGGRPGGVIGAEQHLVPAVPAHVGNQLGRVPGGLVGRGVNVDVLVFGGKRDHFCRPGVADVPADDVQLGEVNRYVVEVGDGAPGF